MFDPRALNPQQREAVETLRGPILILAGAGTGKTRVITCRIANLLRHSVAPEHILAVTFTNKAAREMQERVRGMLPRPPRPGCGAGGDGARRSVAEARPTICTFHSLCVRILRQHIDKLGYKRNFVIFDEAEQLGAIKKILSHVSTQGEKADPAAVLGLLSRFRNGGQRAAAFADPNLRALAEHVCKRYESALKACNAVDFDDLILLTLRLFEQHPEALAACCARYRYVMVDEYQDTNAAQFRLVHALTQEHRNLCVVGDDDQSIYGWRGAEVANLLDLEQHFPEVKIIKLEQNYRSTNTILQAANALIRHNVRRRPKQLWSRQGQGDPIVLDAYATDDEEAKEVVRQIEFARATQRVPWREHAILFRTNLQSRPLETALRAAGVRYHLIGGQSFFDRREIRDFLAYLKAWLNPHNDVPLLRIANVPARGLSDVTMERLLGLSHARHCSVFEAMKHPAALAEFQPRTRQCVGAFVDLVERTHAALFVEPAAGAALSLRAWAERFLHETGYLEDLRRSEKDAETGENRVRNLKDLVATMDDAEPQARSLAQRLQTFLDDLTLETDREADDEPPGDAVTLITMHSCKGLEFPRVFIVGAEDGLIPHSRSKLEGTLDEERRLFYVAVTRAMHKLAISHCAARRKYGQLVPCHPSPFLADLPAELVEDGAARRKQPVAREAGARFFAEMHEALN